jgi:hypothetical protein
MAASVLIHPQLLIPELLRAAPQARPVLDRYGLRGCGGAHGPVESLEFFAKAHDVNLAKLLEELRVASIELPVDLAADHGCPCGADTIYRPFFKAGIAVVLSLGAVWGAYLLLRIAFDKSFHAVGIHEVNAHGHAQIFGWVGLFVMGFAYQAFPRFKHTALANPRLAFLSFGLMLAGIIARSVFEPLTDTLTWAGVPALGGAAIEILAVCLFVGVITQTWRNAGKGLAVYDYYILAAFFWFIVQAVYEAVYLGATLAAPDRDALLNLVATWQGSLRDVQIHGFALLMILGVSQRLFHHFYGFPAPNSRRSVVALVCLNVAVICESVGLVLMRQLGHGWSALWYAGVLLLSVAVVALIRDWRIFRASPDTDRSLKFLRTAYAWLLISLAMLVALPIYQFGLLAWLAPESAAAQMGFSHAYYGAIRHAITVGFISLMIVGVAAKVVPTLNGVDVRALSPLWLPFILLNLGCALRVIGQTATDLTATAFPFAGVSGLLEVTALALWGVHLWLVMSGRAQLRASSSSPSCTVVRRGEPLLAAHRVGDVLDNYPYLLDTFLQFGFRPLANPLLRRTVARFVTIEQASRQCKVDLEQLLAALNAAKTRTNHERLALPTLSLT